jgi:hypothetical protein
MAFKPYCDTPPPPKHCEPEPPCPPVNHCPPPVCEPPPVCPPPPVVDCTPPPPVCPPVDHCPPPPPPPYCPPPPTHTNNTGGNGGNGGNTGDSTNQIASGGNAGPVTAGNGNYISTGDSSGNGGLLNLTALNGIGGMNILSPSIGGPAIGLGAIFERDTAGDGGDGGNAGSSSLFGSVFGKNTGGNGGNGGNTGDSVNQIAAGGDAGAVTAGDGTFLSTGDGDGHGSLINVTALNGIGGMNILSPSIGGPAIGLGAIFERDTAGDGGDGGNAGSSSLLGSMFGKNTGGDGGNGGNTGDSTNQVAAGGNAGAVTAGDGNYVSTGDGAGNGGLLNVTALNGIGGMNILSPSIGGPAIGLGAIFERDTAGDGGDGGNAGAHGYSLFGQNAGGDGGNGGNTGDSANQIATGGDAGSVNAGDGTFLSTGDGDDHGSLINVTALNGVGGMNILSPSIGGPAIGLGAIFERDTAGDGGDGGNAGSHGYSFASLFGKNTGGDGGNGGSTGDSVNQIAAGGDAGPVTAGDGNFLSTGDGGDHGSLINLALLNGIGGMNILSPSIGGPAVGLGAIFESDTAGDGGDGGHAYDGHVALALDHTVMSGIDSAFDLLTSTTHLFDVPALDVASVLDHIGHS